jgi:hypothetical protein
MNSELKELIRSSSATLELNELLKKSPKELLGVSPSAVVSLEELGIKTIFDLGTSNLFASARAAMAMVNPGTVSSRFGLISGDLINTDQLSSLNDIPNLTLDKLRILTTDQAQKLTTAIDVKTIRDLALWPPHMVARRLVGEAIGSNLDAEDIQTEELRPRMGQYPTERVYYTTLVMLQTIGDTGSQIDLTGPISLDAAIQSNGSLKPAVGALLTFSQSWYSQGVTLGHMLHSLALAPGEATRIAVIDWSRRTRATATEAISETEQLDSATEHSRALSEVQQATANDFQAGGSQSSSSSSSSSEAIAASVGTGLLTSLWASGDMSANYQSASTSAQAESSSWSIGNRSVLGSMAQNVNDRTEQHSSNVRNRRATAVREVSQSEHEQVSTRVVANYNHMHALTVQYYEVVQIYRTEVKLHQADRCLFVPMAPLVFYDSSTNNIQKGIKIVERFRTALIYAALNNRIRSLLVDDTTAVSVKPESPIRVMSTKYRKPRSSKMSASSEMNSSITHGQQINQSFWDPDEIAKLSLIINRSPIRSDSNALYLPDDIDLLSVSFEGLNVQTIIIKQVGNQTHQSHELINNCVDLSQSVPFIGLDSISIVKIDSTSKGGSMTLSCSYLGRHFDLPSIPVDISSTISLNSQQKVVSFKTDQTDRRKELLQHLQSQCEYYSRAIFRSLDSATLTLILSNYKWNGKSLNDIVEPRPVRVAGNYLILRAPVDEDENSGLEIDGEPISWQAYLKERGLDLDKASDPRIIPIPTGGVFAEAVLGRSNCAEKLDITRFWNWQDSPIPLSPTDIAPVDTGSRATPEDLKPGQLSSPVLNIVNPTSLPAPDSISTVLNALSNLNFRDMSGLAGTQGLVKAGMEDTLKAATDAGKLASDNMKTEAQKAVAMGQIAADLVKSLYGSGSGKDSSSKTLSAEGARINHGRNMDERGVPGTGGKSRGSTGGGDGSSPQKGGASSKPGGTILAGAGDGDGTDSVASNSPDNTYSREAAYADIGASGVSPDEINATTSSYQPVLYSPALGLTDAGDDIDLQMLVYSTEPIFNDAKSINDFFQDTTGLAFLDWFEVEFGRRKNSWPDKLKRFPGNSQNVKDRFVKIWDGIPRIFNDSAINLAQFATFMTIIMREDTNLKPGTGEGGSLLKCVKYDKAVKPESSNRKAYDLFADADYISAHGPVPVHFDRDQWNTPLSIKEDDIPSEHVSFIQEADFFKFRGRGIIQLTGRGNYTNLIRHIQSDDVVLNNEISISFKNRWRGIAPGIVATTSKNADWNQLFGNTDYEIAHLSVRVHNQTNGNYLNLIDADKLMGKKAQSIWNAGYKVNKDKYANEVQQSVIALLNALEYYIVPNDAEGDTGTNPIIA